MWFEKWDVVSRKSLILKATLISNNKYWEKPYLALISFCQLMNLTIKYYSFSEEVHKDSNFVLICYQLSGKFVPGSDIIDVHTIRFLQMFPKTTPIRHTIFKEFFLLIYTVCSRRIWTLIELWESGFSWNTL